MSLIILNVDEVRRTLSASGGAFVVHDKEVDLVRFAINSGFADIVLDGQVALRVMYQRPGESQVRAQTLTYYDTDGLRSYYDWHLLSADLAKNGSLTVALCILDISGGEVGEWHTTPCAVRVLSTIHTDDSDEADESITPTVAERVAVLESMIQRVASGAPIVVASASDMTDTSQIYVLSTDGNWYYYNGSAWVAGGEYGAVSTDTTLTQSGIPADAKKTGDEITAIKADLGNIYPAGTASGNVASFADGSEMSLDSLIVSIDSESGCTGVTVWRTGKNLFNVSEIISQNSGHNEPPYIEHGYIKFKNGNSAKVGFQWAGLSIPCPVKFSGTFKNFSEVTNALKMTFQFDDGTTASPQIVANVQAGATAAFSMTIGSDGQRITSIENAWTSGVLVGLNVSDTQLEFGSQKTSFEAYNGQAFTKDWTNNVGAVHTGSVDLINGTLTVTDGIATTYQLGATDVKSLLGNNNIWSNAGFVTVLYRKDIKKNLDERFSEKQDELTFDSIPISGSANPVKSGGVKLAIESAGANINLKYIDRADMLAQLFTRPLFIVYTDIHNSSANLERIKAWANANRPIYLRDAYCLGDMVYDQATDNIDFANDAFWKATLKTIGNHDVLSGLTIPGITSLDAYNKYLAADIGNWNVTQPENAAIEGLNYYYKDYDSQVRIIVLDTYFYTNAQHTWFVNALENARTNNLSVIVCQHEDICTASEKQPLSADYPFGCKELGFTGLAYRTIGEGGNYQTKRNAVDNFIAAGGTFICWMSGHVHTDMSGYYQGEHGKQLSLVFANASQALQSSIRVNNYSQDCFSYVAVDTTLGYIFVLRIGTATDKWYHSNLMLCYDYVNHAVIEYR